MMNLMFQCVYFYQQKQAKMDQNPSISRFKPDFDLVSELVWVMLIELRSQQNFNV